MSTAGEHVEAATPTERILADALAQTLRLERVSVVSHFFDDLGANSLLMAQFSALVRKQTDLPSLSMKDIYLNPTIRQLAAALGDLASADGDAAVAERRGLSADPVVRGSSARYTLAGALQLLVFLAVAGVAGLLLHTGFQWISAGAGPADTYLRAAVFATATFVGLCALPIVAKWLLVGRWKAQEIPPVDPVLPAVLAGEGADSDEPDPAVRRLADLPLYLRALGAKVGRGVVIFSRSVPVCTDLITIGAGTVIRKDSSFAGYRALAGRIQTRAGHAGPRRGRRREDGARHRGLDG